MLPKFNNHFHIHKPDQYYLGLFECDAELFARPWPRPGIILISTQDKSNMTWTLDCSTETGARDCPNNIKIYCLDHIEIQNFPNGPLDPRLSKGCESEITWIALELRLLKQDLESILPKWHWNHDYPNVTWNWNRLKRIRTWNILNRIENSIFAV